MTPGSDAPPSVGPSLRLRMLQTTPAECGIAPSPDYPAVYGIVMDFPVGGQFVTLASLCDGNASLYTTSTFGIIGGIGHERVRNHARAFVKAAAAFARNAAAATDFSYPAPGHVRFYFLMFDGVRMIEAPLAAIERGQHSTRTLYGHGHAVVTELRLTMDQTAPDQPSATGSETKEFSGPNGYVHCLLTAMGEGALHGAQIDAAGPLPSLPDLATGNEATRRWLIAQDFAAERISPRQVISTIARMAGLTPLPFFSRNGSIRAVIPQPDGTARPFTFRITLAPFGRTVQVMLLHGG